MAALVAGVQYGLSSHSNFHENKSLIFVKLTDSAYRAIEDYQRNRNKTSATPTIQFLGNEGQLSFPSSQASHGTAGFTFSLSGSQEIEGPQGSFECIQQTGSKSLESLGTLPCKMQIQAKDDVYEATRHRMAVAEENHKNKRTRVIKPNGPDIGRKIKLKAKSGGAGRTIPPAPPPRVREPTPAMSASAGITQPATGQSRLSSYKPTPSNNPTPAARAQPEKKVSDIMRRPLKERLIHLLALRPFKKPELHERIYREGIQGRDRNVITVLLKQVALMRDNTYHLHRHVWNDVQEDWPFYTEQEKAMLKRRKPQNLTPPGSSDGGSCGSGQSPNSTHPGSPPGITAPPPGIMSSKRPGYYQGNDGLPTKRPRISHYRKPEPGSSAPTNNSSSFADNGRTSVGGSSVGGGGGSGAGGSSSNGNVNNNNSSGGGGVGGVGGGSGGAGSNNWDQRQQRERDYRAERTNSEVLRSSYGARKSCLTPSSDCEEIHSTHSNLNSHNSHSSLTHNNVINNHNGNSNKLSSGDRGVVSFVRGSGSGIGASPNASDRRDRDDRGRERERERERKAERERERDRERDREQEREKNVNSGSSNFEVSTLGGNACPGNTSGNSGHADLTTRCSSPIQCDSNKTSEYPDYLTNYTTISSNEQRRRYKAEFSADYEEYQRLHAQVTRVSRRFAQLEELLKKETQAGNVDRVLEIKNQIVSEYHETKNDPIHQQTKRRFNYLHDKLSHLKRLVLEYDSQNSGGGGGSLHY